ncbi:DUF4232 domain-containing protein [Streptomyces natalensis]|uniref:DUF4232 domain-containing protein n=1 Tax=Streptomyces natalensis ATCC 27448 TaxID=1240678 RepID=A0A0D7CT87_9ACTN|nr:DUF4232 domain-containing protein [Streptomyces natalensis]KIZ19469.1 hypothetical protein SNA_02820 [Streptomyces natalensis ATCC 27448]
MPRSQAALRARTARRRTLRIAVAALTAGVALTLTACGSRDGADALQTRRAKPVTPMSRNATPMTDDGIDGAARTPRGQAACDTARVRIAAKPLTRPVNHLLLEATNTSGAPCTLYAAPFLKFGPVRAPLATLRDSKPRAVVTLAPGASGYAAVRTSSADGSGRHGRRATTLRVGLAGRDGSGTVGGAAKVPLPGGAVYLDDGAWVTYWQPNPDNATRW